MVYKIEYYVELMIDYQPAKFQCCRLSVACFIDRLRKDNDNVIVASFYTLLGFENLKFYDAEYRQSAL